VNAVKLLTLLLAVLLLGQMTDWPVADTLSLALGAILVLSWLWSRASLRGIEMERRLSADRAEVGGVIREDLLLRNRSRFPKLWLEAVDHSALPGHDPGRVFHLRGRSIEPWEAETVCVRRGRYRLGPLTLRSGDPLGLFPTRAAMPATHDVVVYPPMVPVSNALAPVAALEGGITRDRRAFNVTPSVAGIREYTPGDSLNRISWSQTARRGRLMTKEFDLDQTADLWIVVDLDHTANLAASYPLDVQPDRQGRWPVEAWLDATEEYSVTITASLARHFLDEGRSVGLIATGNRLETIAPDRGDRQLGKLLESLAVVAADGHTALAEILVAESPRFGRQTGVIVVTAATDERWVTALAEIAAHGARAAVIIVEADTFAVAPSPLMAVSGLAAAGIPAHIVKYGDDIAASLGGHR
jgi:uncharacterized protein (DUF58 family)